MNIISFGSCLSRSIADNCLKLTSSSNILMDIRQNRSDQFYHYYIAKDKKIPNRSLIEKKLIRKVTDVSLESMLDNQYATTIGSYCLKNKYSITDFENLRVDLIIMDNFYDMSAVLSYFKSDKDRNPLLIRKNDFENYNDLFDFGEKLTIEDSIKYFEKIVNYLYVAHPSCKIYFINFPVNLYQNIQRTVKGLEFEKLFDISDVKLIPAPYVEKQFQRNDKDATHFDNMLYLSLAAYIVHDYKIDLNNYLSLGKLFRGPQDYYPVNSIIFEKQASWSLVIELYEYDNDGLFNFFFGERGTKELSVLRRDTRLFFRADDGKYVGGGVEFLKEQLNRVIITYENGNFVFFNNHYKSKDFYPTTAIFNNIGSGFDGTMHETPTRIFKAKIFNYILDDTERKTVFNKNFIAKKTALLDMSWL